jgi:hypothetical protein
MVVILMEGAERPDVVIHMEGAEKDLATIEFLRG